MNQDNMDDKIKDIFGSLDEQDLSAAEEKKEQIWTKIHSDKSKKKSNQWWLFLLLGGLLFTMGWFLNPGKVIQDAPALQEKKSEQQMPDTGLQFALHEANSVLSSQQKSLDSLRALNVSLSNQLLAMSRGDNTSEAQQQSRKIENIIRDTIYLTEVKVEQRIVEKVIRDTVILELPGIESLPEPMAEVSNSEPEELMEEKPISEQSALPSSVEFNFSETNHIDK